MELLPCPFCGSNDIKIKYMSDFNMQFMVGCSECDVLSGYHFSEKDAQKKWNTRHSPWISIKDKLPDAHTYVLCIVKPKWNYRNMFVNKIKIKWVPRCASKGNINSNSWFDEVIAWMPLPQPPKETE